MRRPMLERFFFAVLDNDESDLSIFAQIAQDVGMGISESFAMVASFEFAYFAAPRSAQSLFMSFRFCSIGISSLLGAAYVALFPDPLCDLDFTVSATTEFHLLRILSVS